MRRITMVWVALSVLCLVYFLWKWQSTEAVLSAVSTVAGWLTAQRRARNTPGGGNSVVVIGNGNKVTQNNQ